jgi:hypothetical protein
MTVKVVDMLWILHTCNYFSHPPYGDVLNELVKLMQVLGNRKWIFWQHDTCEVFYSPTILINLYSIYIYTHTHTHTYIYMCVYVYLYRVAQIFQKSGSHLKFLGVIR